MSFTYKYPRPAVTVDIALLNSGNILLIKRGNEPFKDHWALPGGFVDEHEDLPVAALRELKEETNLEDIHLEQFKTYGTPGRDPRGHTVSIVYLAKISSEEALSLKAGDDAAEAKWFGLDTLPPLAFDHQLILDDIKSFVRR